MNANSRGVYLRQCLCAGLAHLDHSQRHSHRVGILRFDGLNSDKTAGVVFRVVETNDDA